MKKRIFLLLTALLITLQLVSCSKGSKPEGVIYDNDYGYTEDSIPNNSVETPSFGKGDVESTSSTNNDLEKRKIIKNANIDFETKEYDAFVDALYSCITDHCGYVQSQDTRGSGVYASHSQRYSNFTIRIPENYYESFIATVGDIGSVTYINEYQNDVTMSYIDLESHIRALEAEYNALISILEKSTNVNDIIAVQSRISEINYQLDSLKSQLRKYDDLISYCTINLSVREVRRETPKTSEMTFGERISAGLSETFADIGDDFTAFAIWFVVSLPYFIIWGVIIAATVLIISAISKKRKRKAEIKRIDKICENINEEQKKD
jgi:hypothetical protein